VISIMRQLEGISSAALPALMQHHMRLAAQQQQQLLDSFTAQQQALVRRLLVHKQGLHPGLLHPTR
jgi:hypothetical protein